MRSVSPDDYDFQVRVRILFRSGRMDTKAISKHLHAHESDVERALHRFQNRMDRPPVAISEPERL